MSSTVMRLAGTRSVSMRWYFGLPSGWSGVVCAFVAERQTSNRTQKEEAWARRMGNAMMEVDEM